MPGENFDRGSNNSKEIKKENLKPKSGYEKITELTQPIRPGSDSNIKIARSLEDRNERIRKLTSELTEGSDSNIKIAKSLEDRKEKMRKLMEPF